MFQCVTIQPNESDWFVRFVPSAKLIRRPVYSFVPNTCLSNDLKQNRQKIDKP